MTKKTFFPIAVKLITIITAIILISLATTTFLITAVIRNDVRVTAENNNFSLNTHSASEAEIFLNSVITNTTFIINLINNSENAATVSESVFETDRTIAAILAPGFLELINNNFFYSNGFDLEHLREYEKQNHESIEKAENGESVLLNAYPAFETQLLALFVPLQLNNTNTAVMILFDPAALTDSFGSGTNKAVLVNSAGEILVSSDIDSIKNGENIKESVIYGILSESSGRQRQFVYMEDGHEIFASFCRLLGGEAVVITTINDEIVFEALKTATRRNIWLGLTVLWFAVLFVWFFSKTISLPVSRLKETVNAIEQGDYDVEPDVRTKDELEVLSDSIVNMSHGLKERERLKESFGRFTNSQIAEKAMKGELQLGGENRFITIFFTDIRNFTEYSEKLLPDEVVTFLNDFLEIMVECITKTGGCVDKFIGDAIMAVWGAPNSSASPKDDALAAVTSAFLMRNALAEYNLTRKEKGLKPIHTGCGINSGDVVAGQVGSHERMEYTVIGDTVNLASRIESINKQLSTDILITENTYKLIKEYVVAEKMPSFHVKGKKKAVKLYAPVALKQSADGLLDNAEQCKTLKELRKKLGMKEPDLSGVDIDEEEKKYNIG